MWKRSAFRWPDQIEVPCSPRTALRALSTWDGLDFLTMRFVGAKIVKGNFNDVAPSSARSWGLDVPPSF